MTYRDRDRSNQPPLPKPYAFVPLAEGRIPLAAPAGHDRFQAELVHGVLTATLIARSPIHVASGLLEERRRDRDNPLVKAHFRTNGRPAIPGTSLKGCVRSIVEAISPSAVTITKAPLPRDLKPSQMRERLDVCQRIFGIQGYQGQISFTDAVLEDGETAIVRSVQLFQPRSLSRQTYMSGERPHGRKFYLHGTLARGKLPLEVCPIDSRFNFTMHFQNLTRGELGLLLFGLGLGEPRLWPKLGGAKPACLGTIEITAPYIHVSNAVERYASFDEEASAEVAIAPLLMEAHAQALVLREQLDILAAILRWPNEERGCPDRNY
ncbi:RAMP superfamily CRISPR-associated protein [Candidatus Chloroploca sp. Khr17]|uniref:RAMP superfamily CRISPR-associated protein n=1 Tax=Candidatus Chloroploca sp. Khr17 TaxID=2496869 RepID=UPI00101E10D9|nr:RAMP superfamily CRISPR-associated protein [Candidatus Chloroploca sp. Khr17]